MILAEEKRKNNVCEYIIHMYQTEYLVRLYDFDIGRIYDNIITHLPLTDSGKQELKNWYQGVIQQMQKEGVEKEGHLSSLNFIVEELTALSKNLADKDPEFVSIYLKAKPYIEENIRMAEGKIRNEIQICLNGIFGYLLLRLHGKEVAEDIKSMLDAFGDYLSILSFHYKRKQDVANN